MADPDSLIVAKSNQVMRVRDAWAIWYQHSHLDELEALQLAYAYLAKMSRPNWYTWVGDASLGKFIRTAILKNLEEEARRFVNGVLYRDEHTKLMVKLSQEKFLYAESVAYQFKSYSMTQDKPKREVIAASRGRRGQKPWGNSLPPHPPPV